MKEVLKLHIIPEESRICKGFGKVDYHDTYQIRKQTEKNVEEISKELMRLPKWGVTLFKLRNSIVNILGLKTDIGNEGQGGFFTLIGKTDNEIIRGEIDKHLNFRVSILKNDSLNTISMTTVVHFNNVLGRLYFLPVKPFHKIIVRTLLRHF
jgi:hypothetical protein